MILDIDQGEGPPRSPGRYDVCIAGAGVAGIVLAMRLAEGGRRVALLEAGGLEYSDQSQAFYTGEIVGRDYFDLDIARLRHLGGTSNHWSGLCRPLDADDFQPHPHIEDSGWPIGIEDLQPHLAEACAILEIPTFPPDRPVPDSAGTLRQMVFFRSPPVRFKDKYLDRMRASTTLDVHLHANLIGIRFAPDGRVGGLQVRGYRPDRPDLEVVADHHVLAMGGLENARMLMLFAERSDWPGTSPRDLVGRYFMEHPHHVVGHYVVNPARTRFGERLLFIGPTRAVMDAEQTTNCAIRVESTIDRRSFDDDARDEVRRLLCESTVFRCTHPSEAGTLRAVAEQVPNPASRVTLSDATDALGLPKVALDWRLSPLDKRTMRAAAMAVGRHFALTNIGRVRLTDWLLRPDDEVPGLDQGEQVGGFHHMGGTRMGRSKDDGVVDRDSRVFGIPNLYLAGSSVFRTSGHANPTLTIVQLALRLADHLATVKG